MLDHKEKDDFVQDVQELYGDLREEHYASLKERKYFPLAKARENKPAIDWVTHSPPVKPTFLGTKVFKVRKKENEHNKLHKNEHKSKNENENTKRKKEKGTRRKYLVLTVVSIIGLPT